MAGPVQIKDGEGTSRLAGVTRDHALKVATVAPSAQDLSPEEMTRTKLFFAFLETAAGSKDMNVVGTLASPVKFKHVAETGIARWVTSARIVINGGNFEIDSVDARRFGSASASNTPLTNGLLFYVEQGGVKSHIFAEPVTRTIEFLNYADDFTSLKNSVSASSDFLSFDFLFRTAVAIPPSIADEFVIEVRDDLTLIDSMYCVIKGYQEIVT